MLRGKRMMALLSTSVLLGSFNSTLTPFLPVATEVVSENNINEMVHKNNLGLIKHPIEVQFENKKLENEKKKAEEQKQKELEQKNNEPEWQEFILTFYTSLDMENGFGSITCQGKKLSRGGVANNVIPQNTKIHLDKWGAVVVNDKGSNKHFSVDTRLDVYIEREAGESDSQYLRRVNSYGVQRVKGYIVK